jgi:hypothetical protein
MEKLKSKVPLSIFPTATTTTKYSQLWDTHSEGKVNLFVWGGSSRMEHTSYISGERYPIAFEALEEVLNTITRSRGRTRVLRAQGINRKMALTRPNCPPRLS